MAEQQLILVDKNDRFLGKYAPKNQSHTGKGLRHRAFTILILNNKKEVLLQKRKHQVWDNVWDLTNSHPLHLKNGYDETIEQAASRCLKREWGVDFPIKNLFGFSYFARYKNNLCENEYCYFLLGRYSGKVFPNNQVAYDFKWLALFKLLKKVKTHPENYTPWLVRSLQELEKSSFLKKLL